jgi:hypothetical protein
MNIRVVLALVVYVLATEPESDAGPEMRRRAFQALKEALRKEIVPDQTTEDGQTWPALAFIRNWRLEQGAFNYIDGDGRLNEQLADGNGRFLDELLSVEHTLEWHEPEVDAHGKRFDQYGRELTGAVGYYKDVYTDRPELDTDAP